MNTFNKYNSLIFIAILTFASACGSGAEVRVVDDSPQNIADRSPVIADSIDSFMQLNAGLLQPVDNMDPLFIDNLSTKRVMSLIYDGLFTVDKNGNVIEDIVTDVAISDDSLTYTFEINTDIFYQNSDVFISGIGRRIQAADIKWAFERTAEATVPDVASKLLMGVAGYYDYFQDQRYIYDSDRRSLEGVSGIEVLNPQTIRFRLIDPDPDFIKKLASPYLSIYPREAVLEEDRSLKYNPVGTGAFRFQEKNDNTTILVSDQSNLNSELQSLPHLNRIDFTYFPQESRLFQAFAAQEIDWIPEVGPETKRVAIVEGDALSPGYDDQYNLHQIGERIVQVYLNDTRWASMGWLKNQLTAIDADSISLTGELTILNPIEVSDSVNGNPDSQYYATYTSDPYAQALLTGIQQEYLVPDSEFALTDIRVPISRIAIYTHSTDVFHNSMLPLEPGPWLELSTLGYGLSHENVSGILNSDVAWKLFVDDIIVKTQQTATQ